MLRRCRRFLNLWALINSGVLCRRNPSVAVTDVERAQRRRLREETESVEVLAFRPAGTPLFLIFLTDFSPRGVCFPGFFRSLCSAAAAAYATSGSCSKSGRVY